MLKSRTFIKIAGAGVIFGAMCALVALLAPVSEDGQGGKWYSIVPPLLAIFLAFLTRNVLLSLGLAVIAGCMLTVVPQGPLSAAAWFDGLATVVVIVWGALANKSHLLILGFIPPIFVMIEVIMASGGFRGIIVWLLKWVKGSKSAQFATALMGILCFIDDYCNAIIVGSMMQPITDKFRVSREKLAFIVDATSAPVTGLAVISTWIAYEVGLFTSVGADLCIGKGGYSMFFDALQFRFYCVLMLVFVFVNVLTGLDFGAMKKAQMLEEAEEKSRTAGFDIELSGVQSGRAINAIIPLGGLILFHITGLWVDGEGPAKIREGGSLFSWVHWKEVIGGNEDSNSTLILLMAALFGLGLSLICGLATRLLRGGVVLGCLWRGVKRAFMPSCILILAWSLKDCCTALETGGFLTEILAGRISPHWFPAILFLVASLTSFATGTSWGTMAILIPTAIPIAFALDGDTYGLTTMISLGAVLDGAIFGDHCSPISDTTIISSTASSCNLIQHVRTQLPYSLLVAALALCFAYLPSAFGLAPGKSLALAIFVMACIFFVLTRRRRSQTNR